MKKLIRMTHQRELILSEIQKGLNHPTADELYAKIKKKLPHISLATVYRNLETMAERGLITKLEISGRQKRFDWDTEPHHHIFCLKCHKVDNISMDKNCSISLPESSSRGYIVSGHRVEVFGICPDCNHEINKTKKESKMACKSKGLSDKQKEVLKALKDCKQECGSKDIAATTTLEPKQVSCQISALKKKGYVESPVRCKYVITESGKQALSAE